MSTVLTKQLAAIQDIALGVGVVNQSRNGGIVQVNKLHIPLAVANLAALTAIDVTKYNYARVVSDTTYTDYIYNAEELGGVESSGPGTWLAVGGASDISWGDINGVLANQTDLQAVLTGIGADIQGLQDTKANLRYTTLQVTGNLTLTTAHLGLMLYTLVGTAGPFVITVPAGLGDGFHVSMIHRGTSTVTFAGSGATVNAQAGGTLVLAQDGRASLVGCGASNIYDLVGVVVAA